MVYREAAGVIACPWEFAGGDAVAAVRVGTAAEWVRAYPWAAGRREEIVGRIAAEVIRQRAPSCRARLDESSGWLSIVMGDGPRQAPPPRPASLAAGQAQAQAQARAQAQAQADAVRFVHRFRSFQMIVALLVCGVALVVGAGVWIGKSALAAGTPASRFGESVRSANTIATLVHRLEPSLPSLHRDGSKDRFTVGVLLHAADGSVPPRMVEIARRMTSTEMLNSKLLGIDAQFVWFRGDEHGAIDIAAGRVLSASDFARVQPLAPTPSGRITDLATGDRALELHLAAGGLLSPTQFLLAADATRAARDFKPGGSTRAVVDFEPSKEPILLFTGEVESAANDAPTNGRVRLGALVERPNPPVFHASFLRASRAGPLLVVPAKSDPTPPLATGLLRLHWTSQYRSGTVHLSRVDELGTVVWERDLGLSKLEEILPDPQFPAFIGTLPAPSGRLPEPALVIVDAATGAVTTHALVSR